MTAKKKPVRAAPQRAARPKHSVVAAALIDEIRSGRHAPGALLPSEPELCRRFEVSRHTIRVALRSLYEKGLILSRQGHGSIVQATAVEPRYGFACSSIDDLLQYAAATPREVLGTARIDVDPALASWLGCEPGYPWWEIRTRRLQEAGGAAIASSRVYVPEVYGAAVRELKKSPLPLFALMEARYGHHIAQIRQTFSVVAATAGEAADLGLEAGAAVMCVERRFIDERGGLLEVSRSVHPPGAFRYELTVRQMLGTERP
ncbi:MAG: GntR family transcriptional regulator [Gammaproteobacteria bacterium]|nr:GntR family transcriptional regulator [Gammaproteobacteria bacterium]